MEWWQSILLGLVGGGFISGVAAVITARGTAKKSEVEALRGIIDALRERVNELEAENKTLRKKLGMAPNGKTKGLALDL